MTFKSIWRWLRVFLFIVAFAALAAGCLPCAIMIGQGDFRLVYVYLIVFAMGFVIQTLEYRVGWVDDRFDWKE